MPYKSQAQAGYFHRQADMGKMAKAMVAEWDKKSKGKKLPKKVKKGYHMMPGGHMMKGMGM